MLENLTSFEKETMLRFLFYHMSMDTRIKLMITQPLPYNKLVGKQVMKVEKVNA